MSVDLTERLQGCIVDAVNVNDDEVEVHFSNGLFIKVYMIDNIYFPSLEAVVEVYKEKS